MTIYYFIIFFILGAVLASFLNALEYRIKNNLNWVTTRSFCPKCKKTLKFYDNIPIVSFMFLKGKCRYCGEKISWQYPLVEFLLGLIFVFIFFNFSSEIMLIGTWLEIFFYCFISFVLVFIFIYDYKYLEVSDLITIGASLFLFFSFLVFDVRTVYSMLLSVFIGVSFFLLQFLISKGKWIGGGDLRIALFLGIVFDWQKILLVLWLAYIIGALISIILIYKNKKSMKSEIAFGTFLALSAFITLFWGDFIINFYLNLIS